MSEHCGNWCVSPQRIYRKGHLGQNLKKYGHLMQCSPWGHKVSNTTGWLNNKMGRKELRTQVERFALNERGVVSTGIGGKPDHLTRLLRNLYVDQEATVRTGHGTMDWFPIGKGVRQVCISSPCLFTFHAEYILQNVGLNEAQAGIKIAGEISITSDMQVTPL